MVTVGTKKGRRIVARVSEATHRRWYECKARYGFRNNEDMIAYLLDTLESRFRPI